VLQVLWASSFILKNFIASKHFAEVAIKYLLELASNRERQMTSIAEDPGP